MTRTVQVAKSIIRQERGTKKHTEEEEIVDSSSEAEEEEKKSSSSKKKPQAERKRKIQVVEESVKATKSFVATITPKLVVTKDDKIKMKEKKERLKAAAKRIEETKKVIAKAEKRKQGDKEEEEFAYKLGVARKVMAAILFKANGSEGHVVVSKAATSILVRYALGVVSDTIMPQAKVCRDLAIPEKHLETQGVVAKLHGREIVAAANFYFQLTASRFPGVDATAVFASLRKPREEFLAAKQEVARKAAKDKAKFDNLEKLIKETKIRFDEMDGEPSDAEKIQHLRAVIELGERNTTKEKKLLKDKTATLKKRVAEQAELANKVIPAMKADIAEHEGSDTKTLNTHMLALKAAKSDHVASVVKEFLAWEECPEPILALLTKLRVAVKERNKVKSNRDALADSLKEKSKSEARTAIEQEIKAAKAHRNEIKQRIESGQKETTEVDAWTRELKAARQVVRDAEAKLAHFCDEEAKELSKSRTIARNADMQANKFLRRVLRIPGVIHDQKMALAKKIQQESELLPAEISKREKDLEKITATYKHDRAELALSQKALSFLVADQDEE